MTTWDKQVKTGVYAPLWGNMTYPWLLDLPWTYVNPTPISYSNQSDNTSIWSAEYAAFLSTEALEILTTEDGSSLIAQGYGVRDSQVWTNESKS